MNINIPRAATWPPYTWDTTNPDRMAEAEAWVRSLIPDADLIALAVSIAADTRLVDLWPYAEGECASDLQRRLTDLADRSAPIGPEDAPEATGSHTDPDPGVSVAWGVDRAEVTWPPPSPGTHESDLAVFNAGWPGLKDYQDAKRWSRENAR